MSTADSDDDGSDVELADFDDYDPLAVDDDADDPPAVADDGDGDDEEDDAGSGEREDATSAQHQAVDSRKIFVVAKEERISSHVMTLGEMTRAIAIRAAQISTHPDTFTDVEGLSDEMRIARKELEDRMSPLDVRREVGRTSKGEAIIEIWSVNEMTLPLTN
jgi:DNA-directed RNA polymerase I, II, and III subunit RPABC2